MKIRSVFIGNKNEAAYEDKFTDGFNIISSDDNDKGKTVLMQSIIYALGSEAMFPATFPYKDYFYIVEIEVNKKTIKICRGNKTFIVLFNEKLEIFNTESEFKYFINEKIYSLPKIKKNERERIVDLDLFNQIFFVGQDKRDTSKIFNSSYNTKDDFINMIFSFCGLGTKISAPNDINIKEKLAELKNERETLQRGRKKLKCAKDVYATATYTGDKIKKEKLFVSITQKNVEILEINKERNRLFSKIAKDEMLLKELNSLNRSLTSGQLICLTCGSESIGYSAQSEEFIFDVSNEIIRKKINESINSRIAMRRDELEKLDIELNKIQNELSKILEEKEVSIDNLIYYKNEILDFRDSDERIMQIDNEINALKNIQSQIDEKDQYQNIRRQELLKSILLEMQQLYRKINPSGQIVFDSLFSTKTTNYSGSEEMEYYLVRQYALAKILKHNFPIVFDSFRDGELSTAKEKTVIESYKELNNQIIFTATLKDQEENKYHEYEYINNLDYSNITSCKLLKPVNVETFSKKISEFSITL